MTVLGAHHTGFHVADIERSLEFYAGLLGLEVIGRRTITEEYIGSLLGYRGVELRSAYLRVGDSDHLFELIEYRNAGGVPVDAQSANPGTAHICLTVEDLPTLHRKLRTAGVQTMSPEPVVPTHGPNTGRFVAYVADPDGIRVELLDARIPEPRPLKSPAAAVST